MGWDGIGGCSVEGNHTLCYFGTLRESEIWVKDTVEIGVAWRSNVADSARIFCFIK